MISPPFAGTGAAFGTEGAQGVPTSAPVALSWSGGKDSALTLQRLAADPRFTVTALLTSITSGYDRVSIHGVRRVLIEQQAHALGLPLFEVRLEPACSNDAYESAFRAALDTLSQAQPEVRHVAFGDLYLRDVRDYRDRLLAPTAFGSMYPLWDEPTRALAERFITDRFSATLVCTDDSRVDPSFAGRPFDASLLRDLPAGTDPCGENGEFHTFVHDGPIFASAIPIVKGEVITREGRFTYCDLLPA